MKEDSMISLRKRLFKIWPDAYRVDLPSREQLIESFADYHNNRTSFINFTGFVGVIATLFLQVSLKADDPALQSLRAVQALFMTAFCIFITCLLIDFQKYLYDKFVKSLWTFMLVGVVFLTVIVVFIYHLVIFVLTEFGGGLSQYWQWTQYEMIIPAVLAFESVNGWAKSNPDKVISRAIYLVIETFLFLRYAFYSMVVFVFVVGLTAPREPLMLTDAYTVTGIFLMVAQLSICISFAFVRKDKKYFARYLFGATAFFLIVNVIIIPMVISVL